MPPVDGVAGAGLPAGGVPGVEGAGDGVAGSLVAGGGVVDDVVAGSVGELPICDHMKAPTRMTAITAIQAPHMERRGDSGVVRRSGLLSYGSIVMFTSSLSSHTMLIPGICSTT
ncbi:hypothetical protein LCM4573_13410 [Rhizobium sp. LCM 4573]|nr:hypothetical protein LCM4573_13410 [Rhizobium sp. LCM 4573]